MLRVALRRILWLAPTLGVATLIAFWVVSGTGPEAPTSLPVFINATPTDVRDRSAAAVDEIANQGAHADVAADELVRLGGAALPHVLPSLDSLAPTSRARVAQALSPLARRMGLTKQAIQARETATTFWRRYWEDHGIDFRAAIVKRAVRRFATRPSPLRQAEVVRFDTFALQELFNELRASAGRDPERVARLTRVLEHIVPTGPAEGDPDRWLAWWTVHRAEFVTFTGVARVAAMVRETRYGRWAWDLARGGLGRMKNGDLVWATFVRRVPLTAWLVFSFLVLGLAGASMGCVLQRGHHWARARAPRELLVVGALGVPTTVWAASLATPRWVPTLGATLVAAGLGAVWLSRHFGEAHPTWVGRAGGHSETPAARLDASDAWRSLKPTLAVSLPSVVTEVPIALTLAFVLERAFQLSGLAEVTLRAVHFGDVPWLMVVALASFIATGVLQVLVDALSAWLDPRSPLVGRRPEAT